MPIDAGFALEEAGTALVDASEHDGSVDALGTCLDEDGDQVCSAVDNCRTVANPGQEDGDGDGIGNVCEDGDGDGKPDLTDVCPLDNPDDSDGDGVCNSTDVCPADNPNDSDGDGVCNSADPCPVDLLNDRDGDGACDSADPCPADNPNDSDGDGACNSLDPCPMDSTNDSDGDTICDGADGCPTDPTKSAPGVCGCNVATPAGLIGYWALNETSGTTASDVVGSRNGTLRNFGAAPWVAGRFGNALSFDGNNDYVDVGNVSNTLRGVSFWVRAGALAPIATNTGWLSPSANGNPHTGWSNPTNAYASDNQYTNGGISNGTEHDFHGFGMQIPAVGDRPRHRS